MGIFNNKVVQANIAHRLGIPMSEAGRIRHIDDLYNMYEGNHWEGLEELNKAEVTLNYCRTIVDKLVAFEFSKGFSTKMKTEVEAFGMLDYLNDIWDNQNSRETICEEFGQIKSVAGKAWIKVTFLNKEHPNFYDPFGEFPNGYFRIIPMIPNIVFPKYNPHDKTRFDELDLIYAYEDTLKQTVTYKENWTEEFVTIYKNGVQMSRTPNKYGIIPFFEANNLVLSGKTEGKSDLEDIMSINTELNFKISDLSEIIDYHSAPVTVVIGASADNLEKGANKVWSGLPVGATVQNLELDTDLEAGRQFVILLREAMHEIGNVPEIALGKSVGISNTSGVALEIAFSPILDTVRRKRAKSSHCFSLVNKFLILVGLAEGLIDFTEGKTVKVNDKEMTIKRADLFKNEIHFGDVLAKDALVELQKIQLEMKLGLLDREGALKRLGRDDIQALIKKIDLDRALHPELYGLIKEGEDIMTRGLNENNEGKDSQVNSGLQNSPTKK